MLFRSRTAARQASLSITNSQSPPKLMSIESVMPSSHLILCRPLLLLPPIPPSIRVFSNESTLHMRWQSTQARPRARGPRQDRSLEGEPLGRASPPDVKSPLTGKDPDAGRDWGQEEKGTIEDEMAGWHHRLDGHEFGWTLGVGDGQGGLAC